MQNAIAEKFKMTGVYRITKAKLETPRQWKLHDKIVKLRTAGRNVEKLVRKLNNICPTVIIEISNLLPTVGRTAIMDHITNASPSPAALRVNYVALGTNTTTPANADTQLGTETYRNVTASATKS